MLGMILPWIVSALNFNISNFTSDGILWVAFQPYIEIFGNLTWGIIFGFIGAGIYVNERSLSTIMTYLILVGIFFAIVLPVAIAAVFGLILAFSLATVFYRTFVTVKEE